MCRFRLCFAWCLIFAPVFEALSQDYFPNGTAVKLANTDCYRLTRSNQFENGSVWYSDQLDLNRNFKLEFSMNLGNIDANGADGIVFVMQTAGTGALGSSGGGLGFRGFAPAFGIEFDTWQNTDQGDPSYDHCAFLKNGNTKHNVADNLAGPVQISKTLINVEDGKDHHVIVEWNATSKTITLFYDCELRLTRNIDLANSVFNGKTNVYWGFTAATGGSANNQVVCLRKDIIVNDSFKICRGGQVQISAGQSIDQAYSWTPNQNITQTNTQKTTVSPIKSGFYTATYRNFCNQTVQDKIWIEVAEGPKFNLGNDTMLCGGQSLLLQINQPNVKSILWDNGTGTTNRTINQSGTYWARVTDTANCFSTDTVKVFAAAQPSVSLGKDTAICEGAELIINITTTFDVLWDNNTTSSNRLISQPGIYWASVSNPCGVVRDTIVVSLLPAPLVSLGNDTALCAGQILLLKPSDTSLVAYRWQDGSSQSDFTISTEGKYYVEVLGRNGCSAADTMLVTYIFPPSANFPEDTVMCRNEVLQLFVEGRETEVLWNGIAGSNRFEVTNYDGKIQMFAKNNCGEISKEMDVITQNCFCKVYFPNAVTLNDDGLNESFGPVYDCIWQQYHLMIYNRWGEMVFESHDPKLFWNGQYKGNFVPNGYYIWIAHYTALENTIPATMQQKGVVYMLR